MGPVRERRSPSEDLDPSPGSIRERSLPPSAWLAWGGMLIGYWAPWIHVGVAGLTFSGFDLAFFLMFFQRAGYGPLLRERLYVPLWGLALGLALLALEGLRGHSGIVRGLLWLLALGWPLATWPPYPALLDPWQLEHRGGFLGGLLAMLGIGVLPFWPSLWRRRLARALPLLIIGGVGPELIQAWSLWNAHLGLPPQIGWGLPLYGVALALWAWAWWRTS